MKAQLRHSQNASLQQSLLNSDLDLLNQSRNKLKELMIKNKREKGLQSQLQNLVDNFDSTNLTKKNLSLKFKVPYSTSTHDNSSQIDHALIPRTYLPIGYEKSFKNNSSFDISLTQRGQQSGFMTSGSKEKNNAYQKFFSDEYKQYQEMIIMNKEAHRSSMPTINRKGETQQLSINSFDFSKEQEEVQRLKLIQHTQRYTQLPKTKRINFEKQTKKVKEQLDSKLQELDLKYQQEKSFKDQPFQSQLEYYKSLQDLLNESLQKFLYSNEKALDSHLHAFICSIQAQSEENTKNMFDSSFKFHQSTSVKLKEHETVIKEQEETVIQLKTEQVKFEILKKMHAQGYQSEDRELFIKQVDQFLGQETPFQLALSREKLKNASFSGVTQSLDELYQLMQTFQDQSKYFSNTEEQSFNQQAFKYFQRDMKSKVKHIQLQTAKKVMQRLQKNVKFVDKGVQFSTEEHKLIIMQEVQVLSKQMEEQESILKVQDSKISFLVEDLSKVTQEKLFTLTRLRECQDKNQVLEAQVVTKNSEFEQLQFQYFQEQKKMLSMHAEVEFQTKTLSDLNKRVQSQDVELLYLRENDSQLRSELKQLKNDHTQILRELRKVEKKLLKLTNSKQLDKNKSSLLEESKDGSSIQHSNVNLLGATQSSFNQTKARLMSNQSKARDTMQSRRDSEAREEHLHIERLIKEKGEEAAKEYIQNKIKQQLINKKHNIEISDVDKDTQKRNSKASGHLDEDHHQYSQFKNQHKSKHSTDIKNLNMEYSSNQQTSNKSSSKNSNSQQMSFENKRSSQMSRQKNTRSKGKHISIVNQMTNTNRQGEQDQRRGALGNLQQQNTFNSNNQRNITNKNSMLIQDHTRSQSAESMISGLDQQKITKSMYSKQPQIIQETQSTIQNHDSSSNMIQVFDQKNQAIRVSNIQLNKQHQETQTGDLFELFLFFIDFLKKLDKMIDSGQLQSLFTRHGISNNTQEFNKYQLEFVQSAQRLKQIQKYLQKISSIANKGGDVFFRSVFKIFQAQPHIFDQDQIDRYVKDNNQDIGMMNIDAKRYNDSLVKLKQSVGGGFVKK